MKNILKSSLALIALTFGLANSAYAQFSDDDYRDAAYNFTDITMYTNLVETKKAADSGMKEQDINEQSVMKLTQKARVKAVQLVQTDIKKCYANAKSDAAKTKCSYEDNAYATFFAVQDKTVKDTSGLVFKTKYAVSSQTAQWNKNHKKELLEIEKASTDEIMVVQERFSRPTGQITNLERTYEFMKENDMF